MRTGDAAGPADEDGGVAGIGAQGKGLQIGARSERQLQVPYGIFSQRGIDQRDAGTVISLKSSPVPPFCVLMTFA